MTQSPDNSDSDSDSTLEDFDSLQPRLSFGHPLQRMVRPSISTNGPDRDYNFGSLALNITPPTNFFSSFSSSSSDSGTSTTSSVAYDHIDFEALVDELLAQSPPSQMGNLVMVEPSSRDAKDSVMIKCLPATSPELLVLLELNHEEYRQDPWNPAPHILRAVEKGDTIFLCMERLNEFNQPPFKTVANYIDFFRQTLEGLTFLHEHNIAQLCCSNPSSLMVDIGNSASTSSAEQFDRTRYPVRYYFTDFSRAAKISSQGSIQPFRRDVQECGILFDWLLEGVPKAGPKLKSLVKAMTSGGFGADDSRKLFEALCKSLESSVFETPIQAEPIPSTSLSPPTDRPRLLRPHSH